MYLISLIAAFVTGWVVTTALSAMVGGPFALLALVSFGYLALRSLSPR